MKNSTLGHRVKKAALTLVERVAAADTLESHPAALEGAVFFNGFHSILGAGGSETTTGRFRRGNILPIEADKEEKKLFHPLMLPAQGCGRLS